MITQETLEQRLKTNKSFLSDTFHVQKVGYFGSYARGEQNAISDIDILVELSKPIGWKLADLHDFLEDLLDAKVDLVTVNALKPQLKEQILKEVIYL
ncbi:nucleotidyltransferase family protein [Aureibacillus halotolerans]|uniref:Polymerase nucleotidyl transferase domain-containing protein n=1 Tax=Aureibacillus halotolerans TaxID=1508390 RepID=A0A4R6TZA2_9BACI|nr:nucleotidyltransferase family protein [Aureibacillus halotolerans]TDQ37673.1 hypothetical protein EV213_11233 [Aureibacillus halotolerans]